MKAISDLLESFETDIRNCHGVSFDNTANMARKYSGLQA
jgi:hypothetical protein